MKVMLYCQYLLGVGHLFRALRLVAGLRGHEVVLVLGGPVLIWMCQIMCAWSGNPHYLLMKKFTHLIAEPGQDLEVIKQKRTTQLLELLDDFRPDVLLLELYPFGRSMFQFELDPCIELAHSGKCGAIKVVCSLRDILSVRAAQATWEKRFLGGWTGGSTRSWFTVILPLCH